MTTVHLLPATVEHLEALRTDPAAFGAMLGSPVPQGWPEFPESIDFTLERLREHPDEAEWWMHFFLLGDGLGGRLGDASGDLVGSGGFVGPPKDGVVEFGYEVAPAYRGRGIGVAAARAMLDKATASGAVRTVIAHTLAEENPSTGVLRRLGFRFAGEREDPDEGTVWRWERPLIAS